MNSFLLKLVAVASSLVLALPPGWCSGFMRHEGAVPAPAKTACCHQTAKDQPSGSKQPPAAPAVECCCQREATVPEKSAQPTEVSSLALPLVADDALADLSVLARGEAAAAPFRSGPRPHALQCVWRC